MVLTDDKDVKSYRTEGQHEQRQSLLDGEHEHDVELTRNRDASSLAAGRKR